MTNEDYIRAHREEDVRRLALGRVPEGVDRKWCLQQIEGWQLARRKLPQWAATEGVWYPIRLSMEQCSSELTARYKRELVERLLPEGQRGAMTDLTGGLGVDFAQMAPLFDEATYVEILPELRRLAEHNMPLLMESMRNGENEKMGRTELRFASPDIFSLLTLHFSLIYLDPARRDGAGRKTVGIEDCTPNLMEMQDELLSRAQWVVVKLSPMLDITEALRQLRNVAEVHVMSVKGECKELLFVMTPEANPQLAIHCVNLGTDEDAVIMRYGENERMRKPEGMSPSLNYQFLYEPNASVLKAGVQDVLGERYEVRKLHPQSHLFVGDRWIPHFPGRGFRIVESSDFSKNGLKSLLSGLRQANLTIRNFPTPVVQLRRQLRLAEGGDAYLFATTQGDGTHVLIRCEKAN